MDRPLGLVIGSYLLFCGWVKKNVAPPMAKFGALGGVLHDIEDIWPELAPETDLVKHAVESSLKTVAAMNVVVNLPPR